jgi:cytochrome c biogenesis protein CcmG, thiol:disulfide interchange protein DsbE
MSRMTLILIPAAALFIVLAFSLFSPAHHYQPQFSARPLPEFSLPTSQAQIKLERRDFMSKVTLLHVFASWCLLCRQELPFLSALGQQVPIYGLLYHDEYTNVEPWFATGQLPYRKLAIANTDILAVALGVYGTPETYIIDACGHARYRYLGPLSASIWQRELLPRVRQLRDQSCV